MAAVDLTTLAYVENYIQDTSAAANAVLPSLITAASTFFQSYCCSPILSADYTEYYNGNGNNRIILRNQPIISVSSVSVCGTPLTLASGAGNGFIFDKYGITYRGWRFPRTVANIAVSYRAGYANDVASVPADIQQCIADMVAIAFKRIPNLDKSSININGQSTSFLPSDLTPKVKAVLNIYQPVFLA